jgi:nitrate reductase NapE component
MYLPGLRETKQGLSKTGGNEKQKYFMFLFVTIVWFPQLSVFGEEF